MIRQLADTCVVIVLLFLNRQVVSSALGCVKWTVYNNQYSRGSLRKVEYKSVSACQNYCIQNNECVAIDFASGSICWVHTDVDNLAEKNTRRDILDITQYRLNRTCDASLRTTPRPKQVCRPIWRVLNDTTSYGAKQSDSFNVPYIDTCLNECTRLMDCIAVDINVNKYPLVCWTHFNPSDLEDKNIYDQTGTNHYQLIGSCASNCTDQSIILKNTHAHGAGYHFNVADGTECRNNCTLDLNCVAVDIDPDDNHVKCWPHYKHSDLRDSNLYSQDGTTLFIPVKRCIASLYWATTSRPGGTSRPSCATSTMMLLLLLLMMMKHLTQRI